MADLIERDKAIKEIDEHLAFVLQTYNKRYGNSDNEYIAGYKKAHEHIKEVITLKLPSAQPEPQWIPCSEKLPEEHEWMGTKRFGTTISDEVYVTFENPKGEMFCKHLSFQNGKLSRFDQSTIDAFYKGSKPIAWMPLPEPYAERRTDETQNT